MIILMGREVWLKGLCKLGKIICLSNSFTLVQKTLGQLLSLILECYWYIL